MRRGIAVLLSVAVVIVGITGAYLIERILEPESVDREYAMNGEAIEKAGQKNADISESYITSDSRQVILSMGAIPGTIYITWTGDEDGPQFFRCAQLKEDLLKAARIKAEKSEVLDSGRFRYKVELNALEEGKKYYYEIGDGVLYDTARVLNVPEENGKTTFAYLADPQFGEEMADYDMWEQLTWDMYENNKTLEFVLIGGDLVNVPTDDLQWGRFLESCSLFANIPVMTIPGNHEGVASNNTYKKLFHHIENGPEDEAFYYFDYGHCRFLMLDSSFLTKDRREAMGEGLWSVREKEIEKWMRETLEKSPKEWNVVIVHHPFYGMHDLFTVSPQLRQYWLPLLKTGGADLVLCGHQHLYMRTKPIDGITHIMGNSGGKRTNYYTGFNQPGYSEALYAAGTNYQVIQATGRKLEITSYDKENRIIDAVTIRRKLTEKISFPYFRIF